MRAEGANGGREARPGGAAATAAGLPPRGVPSRSVPILCSFPSLSVSVLGVAMAKPGAAAASRELPEAAAGPSPLRGRGAARWCQWRQVALKRGPGPKGGAAASWHRVSVPEVKTKPEQFRFFGYIN